MRLKTFTAPSMTEAIRLVRQAMGTEAIIVSDQPGDAGGVVVTAAIDTDFDRPGVIPDDPDALDRLTDSLFYHGVPVLLGERILAACARAQMAHRDAVGSMASALESTFAFTPIGVAWTQPLMLVGPPAAGKTATVAKLAARLPASADKLLISAEPGASGGPDRLAAFARSARTGFIHAFERARLAEIADEAADQCVLIDSTGANPFDDAEMARLGELVDAARAEPVLVLAAGGDAAESAEIAEAFAHRLGVRRLIATRADLARRLGGVLAAADAGHMALAEIALGAPVLGAPIQGALKPMQPMALAKRMLPWAAHETPKILAVAS